MQIELTTELDAPVELVWEAVKQPNTLAYVSRGLLGFTGGDRLPSNWDANAEWAGRLLLFNFIPIWTHRISVVNVDNEQHLIRTEEHGGPVSVWKHTIKIDATSPDHCRYSDDVEIRAGLLTLPVWLFAQVFYRYRHFRWRRLARTLTQDDVNPGRSS